MADLDAVVIGSGIGGMSAALELSRRGRTVTLVEAADEVGGLIRPIERQGYSFDVGLHYLGKLGPGELFREQLDRLGLGHVEFVELDPDGFDRYCFPGFEIRLCKGRERFTRRLVEAFPDQARGIRDFFDLVARVDDALVPSELSHHGFIAALGYLRRHPALLRYGRATYANVLDDHASDPHLRAVLGAPLFDVGLEPGRVSAIAALGLWGHLIGGAYYPRGGARGLRDAFVDALHAGGVHILTSAPVQSLVKRGGEWITALEDGRHLCSSVVVSAIDPTVTLGSLVEEHFESRRTRHRAAELRPSIAVFFANLGTDLDLAELGFSSANLAHFETWDIDDYFASWRSASLPHRVSGFFATSATLKDPGGGHAPAGRHSLQILGGASYEPFERWAEVPEAERGGDYRDLVSHLGAQLVLKLEADYAPGLSDHLELVDFRSPLFLADRNRAVRGGMYGPEQTPDQVGRGRYPGLEAGIDGLYLAGAGTLAGGVAMSCSSGALAAGLADAHLERPMPLHARDLELGTWS